MKTHELVIADYSPDELLRFLATHNIQRGDTLKITTTPEKETVILLVVVSVVLALSVYYKKQKREQDGEGILNRVFEGIHSLEELEKHVAQEYGIIIQVETVPDAEKEFMYELSAKGLLRAYAADEPEYTEADLQEPNPNYKAWKKGK